MDRDALARFMRFEHRTFRWNDGEDHSRYEAVESTDEGLRWYRWSHHPELDQGGAQDVALQGYAAFLADGPLRALPEEVAHRLREHVAKLTSQD
ncbi:MAG: hypothetical protein R3B40_11130 [Polyangiales bacterium]|nr:hypothetical protein [Myxococcales bacterium]MCB9657994.1 hypothetical protein [Sandaracinaceae bacterium]